MFKKKGRQKRLPAGGKRKRPFSSVPVIISSIAPAASASTMAMNQASLAAVEHPPPGASATSTSSATSTADLSMDQAWNAALLNSTSSMWLPSSQFAYPADRAAFSMYRPPTASGDACLLPAPRPPPSPPAVTAKRHPERVTRSMTRRQNLLSGRSPSPAPVRETTLRAEQETSLPSPGSSTFAEPAARSTANHSTRPVIHPPGLLHHSQTLSSVVDPSMFSPHVAPVLEPNACALPLPGLRSTQAVPISASEQLVAQCAPRIANPSPAPSLSNSTASPMSTSTPTLLRTLHSSLLFPPVPPTVPNAPLYNAEHSLENPSCLNCQQHQAAISVLRQQLQIAQRPCTECKRYRELALAPCTECPKLERLITVGNTRKRNQVNHDMDKGQPETTGLQAQVDELKAKLRKMDEELAVAQVTVVIQQEEIQRMRAEAGAAALA